MSKTEKLKEYAELILKTSAVAVIVGNVFWFFFEDNVERWAGQVVAQNQAVNTGPCVVIPAFGHTVSSGFPGSSGVVQWRGVKRLRSDCGTPTLVGVISNGDDILHNSDLSVEGLNLVVGIHDLKYRFAIPENVKPGDARFRVIISYPNAENPAPPATTPWVGFTILRPVDAG